MTSPVSIRFICIYICISFLCSCGSGSNNPANDKILQENRISFEQTNRMSLDVGQTYQNAASALGNGDIIYSSSNTDVASVSKEGLVTAHSVGNAQIMAEQFADENFPQVSSTYQIQVGFTMVAWMGEENTVLNLPEEVEGLQLYRTKNFECDFLNNSNCNSGLLNYLSVGSVNDELTTLNDKTSYHFTNENKSSGLNLNFPLEELTGKSNGSIVSFDNKVWIIGGVDGTSDYLWDAGAEAWSTVDGVNWKKELDNAPFGKLYDANSIVFQDKIWLFGGLVNIDRNSSEASLKAWASLDGKIWNQVETNFPFEDALQHIFEFDQKLWVVTKDSQENSIHIWSSNTGKNWTKLEHNIPLDELNSNIVEFNGRLLALGIKGIIWVSEDGITWKKVEIEVSRVNEKGFQNFPSGNIYKLNNKLYCYNFGSEMWLSEDGFSWKEFNSSFDDENRSSFEGEKVVHQNQIWNISGEYGRDGRRVVNQVEISSDGLQWLELENTPVPFNSRSKVVFYKDRFLLLGGYAGHYADYKDIQRAKHIYSSNDGFNWTLESEQAEFGLREYFKTVEYQDKLWLLGGYGYNSSNRNREEKNDIWFSNNGITWGKSEKKLPINISNKRSSSELVAFKEKLWLFNSEYSEELKLKTVSVWSTTNFNDWHKEVEFNLKDNSYGWLGVNVFKDQLWLQEGKFTPSGLLGYKISNFWNSRDGKTWEEVNFELPFIPKSPDDLIVKTLNGQLIAIGADNWDAPFMLTSSDGFDWNRIDNNSIANINGRSYGQQYVVADNKLWVFGGGILFLRNKSPGLSFRVNPRPIIWRSEDLEHWEKGVKVRINLFDK
ncbi:Ig-like domain-containing protein [Pseudomonas sp. HK3]